ncbi:Adenylate kinase 7 [Podochytrium sp. JEL0797]|nr:Adenylate kinase 7 [Podochytrium sp. JEL0797]
MRCFVSNIDSPTGHNFSRLLASTVVGSRKEPEPEEDDGAAAAAAAGEGEEGADSHKEEKPPKQKYMVWGTLCPIVDHPVAPSLPGVMVETGDKKKDAARREAIEKFAVKGEVAEWVQGVIKNDDREELKQALLGSDVIIYDLNQSLEEASWAIEMLAELSDTFLDKPKTFIALSSIMTWSKTKVDQDDPEASLAEDEYRRRKAHPNYKTHIQVEKSIMKFGKKGSLKTYVVASGLVYHAGDSIFHHMLKAAWHNEELVCYGEGANNLPTIHLDDLTNIIVEVVEFLPENKYLLAIDESKNSLYDIVKAISDGLGTGNVKKVPKEMALLNKNLPQSDFDMLLVNLRLEPGHIKEMTFEWKYESGMIENLPALIQEFKDARGLSPLKIILHGPPASGKSFYAQKLAKHYEIHYVELDLIVKDSIAKMERRAGGTFLPDEDDTTADADRELLEEIKEATRANNGKYPDEYVVNFLKDKLRSMPCRNQGYILDGYPGTIDEAANIFKPNEDDMKDDKVPLIDEVTGPEFVITLEVADEFIKERMMNLPEAATVDTKNSEEALIHRLEEFRAANTDETTVLNYFDELEIHPFTVAVTSNEFEFVLETMTKFIGKPHNYGPTLEQLEENQRQEEELKAAEVKVAEEEREKREKEESERQVKAVAEWNVRMEEIRKQEQEVLEAQSVPLRNYLMKYVMPTLTSGLIEVCKVRPDDPVDYLAEFLFKHNS